MVSVHWCESSTSSFLYNIARFLCTLLIPSLVSLQILRERLLLIFGNKDISSGKVSQKEPKKSFLQSNKETWVRVGRWRLYNTTCELTNSSYYRLKGRVGCLAVGCLAWLNSSLLCSQVFQHNGPLMTSATAMGIVKAKTYTGGTLSI